MANARTWLVILVCVALNATRSAADDGPSDRDLAYEDRIATLERTVDTLATELERTRRETVVPENPELKSKYGMGPAASKVFDLARGLSIGGYGEINYTHFTGDKGSRRNTADALRGIIYVGYKFTENIVFNSEIEIEHADEIFLEFAELNFFWKDYLNAKAGLLLNPMGFLNQIHEPPFFFGVKRPDVETVIIPSTWRENGAGIFGSWDDLIHYKLFVMNGLDATGFSSGGLRGGRQKGSRTLAEHVAVVGRLDLTPMPGVLIGGSFYHGGSGQNQFLPLAGATTPAVTIPDTETTLFDIHAEYKGKGLHLRGLFAMAFLEDAAVLTAARAATDASFSGAIAEQMLGGYAEIAYDIWPFFGSNEEWTLEPFYRFEYFDTQHRVPAGFAKDFTKQVESHTVGLNFEPIPNVVLKVDYRHRDSTVGLIADELNMGIGYVF